MRVIRDDIGGFFAADADGWITNPAVGTELQSDWRPALDLMIAAARAETGDAFHSFYVRGSVSCGHAVRGSSDLDTVLLVDDAGGERRPAWQVPLGERVVAQFPFITDTEVVVLGRRTLLAAAADLRAAHPVMAQWVFLLATGARCLAGDDVLPALGRFRAGPDIAFVLRNLPAAMDEFAGRLASVRTDAERQKLCAWMCKKLLRSGAELAMLDDPRFTRDLGPSARQLAARLPDYATAARQLLTWAVDPPTDLAPLATLARELARAIERAARERGVVMDAPEQHLGWAVPAEPDP